jgi:hypothetical protein
LEFISGRRRLRSFAGGARRVFAGNFDIVARGKKSIEIYLSAMGNRQKLISCKSHCRKDHELLSHSLALTSPHFRLIFKALQQQQHKLKRVSF